METIKAGNSGIKLSSFGRKDSSLSGRLIAVRTTFLLVAFAGLLVAVAGLGVLAQPAMATEAEFVPWNELATTVEPFDDPFVDMSTEHKWDLRDVLLNREAAAQGHTDAALSAKADAALERLDAAGLDVDDLLEQRLVVMERRREAMTGVTSTFLDRKVLIDGYLLPLKAEAGRVVEFLILPWVGACIHTPPPPPNQIVHVTYPMGLVLERQFEAVRLEGILRHEPEEHDLFLLDGSRQISVSYGLSDAVLGGTPGEIVAASASEIPILDRAQIWVNSLYTSGMPALGEAGSGAAIFWALLLSFGYGALHTLGPGHGKAVVISYFVGTGGSLRRGLTMGARIAVFHVLSAVVVVFLLDLAVQQTTGAAPSDYRAIRMGSYALVIVIGAVMLWQAISAMRRPASIAGGGAHKAHHHEHSHGTSGCAACTASVAPRGSGWVAAAVGVVPCTGALLVMLFGLANDLIWPAIAIVVAISVGMAVAMSLLGMAALWGRGWAERRLAPDARRRQRFETGARLAGATCVLVVGVLLFTITAMHDTSSQRAENDATLRLVDAADREG
ncbi:DUF3299 domain-containing protein [Rubrimonas cliftonensis]|uniref:ABC-type nickel/cobalt efflux system, permease component RcnA n=1 Tax=Rubrimonas cliftonensis TaxID=89524 RepID=A0A1H4F1Q6_9RHOB|nr:DUF3299 domain-containing protein [Rubrimonas cliftonensis]SEA90910.1 ABC-type nickel/cobalt efflux system, permease component RcnA [Rubrimonas cliftonensis]